LQGKRDECYETRLRIQRVEMNDARHYYLTVENDKGSDTFYVTLTVKGMQQHACHHHLFFSSFFLSFFLFFLLLNDEMNRRARARASELRSVPARRTL
jgi:hypothetical protein